MRWFLAAALMAVVSVSSSANAQSLLCDYGVLRTADDNNPQRLIGVVGCGGWRGTPYAPPFVPLEDPWWVSPTDPAPKGELTPLVPSHWEREGTTSGAAPAAEWVSGAFRDPETLAPLATYCSEFGAPCAIPPDVLVPPVGAPTTTATVQTGIATGNAQAWGLADCTTTSTCPDVSLLGGFVDDGTSTVALEQRGLPYLAPSHGGAPDDFSRNHGDDPVHPGTGEFILRRTDLSLSGFGLPFTIRRVYRSAWRHHGALGHAWTHGYEQRLLRSSSSCGDREFVDWLTGEGDAIRFVRPANGVWIAATVENYDLTFVSDPADPRWEITAPDGVRYVFGQYDGTLRAIVDLNGNALAFQWGDVVTASGAERRLLQAVDTVGRVVTFHYGSDGYLDGAEVRTAVGALIATVSYDVDARGDLVAAYNASGIEERYEYDTDPSRATSDAVIPAPALDGACEEYCTSCAGPCVGAEADGFAACMFDCYDPDECAANVADECKTQCAAVPAEDIAVCSELCQTGCLGDPATCDPLRPLTYREYHDCLGTDGPDGERKTVCPADITDPNDPRLASCCMPETRVAPHASCVATVCPLAADSCEETGREMCDARASSEPGPCSVAPVGQCPDHSGCVAVCEAAQTCGYYDSGDWEFFISFGTCWDWSSFGDCQISTSTPSGHEMGAAWDVTVRIGSTIHYDPDDTFTGRWCMGTSCNESEGGPITWHADGTYDNQDPDDWFDEATGGNYWACNIDNCKAECATCEYDCRNQSADVCRGRVPAYCESFCPGHCQQALPVPCENDCIARSLPQCEYGACRAACGSVDYTSTCEATCVDQCKAANTDPAGPRYGNPIDLDHNLIRIIDGAGRVIVDTGYESDVYDPDFDRVVWQEFGGDLITYDAEAVSEDAVDLCPTTCLDSSAGLEQWIAVDPGDYLVFTDGMSPFGQGGVGTWPVSISTPGGLGAARWFEIQRDPADEGRALLSPPVPGGGSAIAVSTPGGELTLSRHADGTLGLAGAPAEALAAAFGPDGDGTLTLLRTLRGWRAYPGRAVGGARTSDLAACADEFQVLGLGLGVTTIPKEVCDRPVGMKELGRRDVDWRSLLTTPYGEAIWDLGGGDLARRHRVEWGEEPWIPTEPCGPIEILPEPDPGCLDAATAWEGAEGFKSPPCDQPWYSRGRGMEGDGDSIPGFASLGCPPPELPPIPPPCAGEIGFGDAIVRAAGNDAQPIARKTTVLDPRGTIWVYYSSSDGTILRIVNEATGARTDYNYSEGRLVGTRTPFGDRRCTIYDLDGNAVQTTRLPAAGTPADQARIETRTRYWFYQRPLEVYDPNVAAFTPIVTYEWDARGNLERVRTADAIHGEIVEQHLYDPLHPGRLLQIVGPRRVDAYEWDEATGQASRVTRNAAGVGTSHVSVMEYDAFGRPAHAEATGSPTRDWVWNNDGRLHQECVNLSGDPTDTLCTDYAYDDAGLLVHVFGPEVDVAVTLNGRGQIETTTETTWTPAFEQRRTCFVYDAGLLVQEVHPDGRSTVYERDQNGDIVAVDRGAIATPVACAGNVTPDLVPGVERFEDVLRDASLGGVVIGRTSGAGSAPARGGATTSYDLDGYGRVVQVTAPDGSASRHAYDARGRRVWSAILRDRVGLVAGANPEPDPMDPSLVSYVRFDHDPADRITARHDLWFADDPTLGRELLGADGWATTTTMHDLVAGTITTTDAEGRTTVVATDRLGRPVEITSPGGIVTTQSYSADGMVVTRETTPASTPSGTLLEIFEYTSFGELSRLLDGEGAIPYKAEHDPSGRVLSTVTPMETRHHVYDGFGRVIQIDREDLGVRIPHEIYEYDPAGRVRGLEDALGNRTSWSFDSTGRVGAESYDDGTSIAYGYYEGTADLRQKTTRRGDVVSYDVDGLGRTTRRQGTRAESWGTITTTMEYEHDVLGPISATSWSEVSSGSIPDDLVTLTFRRDSFGRPVEEWSNLFPDPVRYERDRSARTLSTSSGTHAVSNTLDAAGRPDTIRYGARTLVDYEWLGGGAPAHADLGNGLREAWTYDEAGRKRAARVFNRGTAAPILDHEYFYATNGTLARVDRWFGATSGASADVQERLSSLFVTDPLGRLDQAATNQDIQGAPLAQIPSGSITSEDVQAELVGATGVETFTYDHVDNLLVRDLDGAPWNAVVSAPDNRLTRWRTGNVSVDADGRTLDSPTNGITYDYDGLGRVRGVTQVGSTGTTTWSFLYDPFDRLVGWDTSAGGATIRFQFADGSIFRQRTKRTGVADSTVIYVRGLDLTPVAYVQDGSADRYNHVSFGERLSAATNASGTVAEHYDYHAYLYTTVRAPTGAVRAGSTLGNYLLHGGQPYVRELSLYHFGVRWFRTIQGRFLTQDPAGTLDGPNRYAYAHSNPVELIDPTGLGAERSGFPWDRVADAVNRRLPDLMLATIGPFGEGFENVAQHYTGAMDDATENIGALDRSQRELNKHVRDMDWEVYKRHHGDIDRLRFRYELQRADLHSQRIFPNIMSRTLMTADFGLHIIGTHEATKAAVDAYSTGDGWSLGWNAFKAVTGAVELAVDGATFARWASPFLTEALGFAPPPAWVGRLAAWSSRLNVLGAGIAIAEMGGEIWKVTSEATRRVHAEGGSTWVAPPGTIANEWELDFFKRHGLKPLPQYLPPGYQ